MSRGWKYILILLAGVMPVWLHSQTFNGTGGSIPDYPGGQTCYNLNVSGLPQNLYAAYGLVSVQVNITHPYVSDLEIVLISPTGVSTILSSNNGGSGANYTGTIFSMSASNPIQTGIAPFTGSYIPEESFYAQNSGQNGNGIWQLCITDEISGDVGTLNSWSITFGAGATGAPTPAPNPVATDLCSGAPLICNLNGYTGSTNTTYTWSGASPYTAEPRGTSQSPNAGSFCGTHVENSSWIRFQASSTSVTLNVDVTNCTGTVASCGERGIQIALYNACGYPWTYSPSTIPTSSFIDCYNNEKAPSCYGDGIYGLNQSISFNNLVVGNIYYIMFDGWAANQCDYTIRVNTGIQTVTITPSSNPMCEGDTIVLTASAPGVLNTYAWSSVPSGSYVNNNTISVHPTQTTVFTVTASGICGSQSASLPVTVIPSGNPSWTAPPDICSNASPINLLPYITGTSGGSWSGPGVVGSTFDPSSLSGNVSVTYTTGTVPCQRTQTHTISVLPSPNPQIQVNSPTSICSYQQVNLSAPSPVGGIYAWNTGSSNDSIWTDSSGWYAVTVTNNNGCFGTDSLQLAITQYPDPNPVIQPSLPVLCPGQNVILTLNQPYAAYSWTGGSVNDSLTVTTAGPVSVVVTDANGCMDTTSTTVLQSSLNVQVTGDPILCQGETSVLTAVGGTNFTWNTSQSGNSITVSSTGWYAAYASDTLGCSDGDSLYVIHTSLVPGILGDPVICSTADSALLSSNPASTYLWNTGDTGNSVYVNLPGTYQVIIGDTLGCLDTAFFNVGFSTINTGITGDTVACPGEPVTLTATGGGTYSWNTGATTSTINPVVTQTYTYTVNITTADGCTVMRYHTVHLFSDVYPPVLADEDSAQTPQNTAVQIPVLLNDSSSGGIITIILPPNHGTATVSGNQIVYTPDNGFAGTDTLEYSICDSVCQNVCDTALVLIRVSGGALFFPEFISPNGDGTNDTWEISGLENYPNHEVIIMNRWGDALFRAKPYQNDWAGQSNTGMVISGGQVTDGTYFFVFLPEPGGDPVKGFIELRK